MYISRVFSFLILMLMGAHSYAGVISYAGYSRDMNSTVVTGGGLQWMQWTETLNETRFSALNKYSSSGWRLATESDVITLVQAFFGTEYYLHEDGWRDYGWEGYDTVGEEAYISFIDLFGNTFEGQGNEFGRESLSFIEIGNEFEAVYIFEKTKSDSDPMNTRAILSPVGYLTEGSGPQGNPVIGIALVRDVPEPSSLGILSLSLAGLCIVRRRQLQDKELTQDF